MRFPAHGGVAKFHAPQSTALPAIDAKFTPPTKFYRRIFHVFFFFCCAVLLFPTFYRAPLFLFLIFFFYFVVAKNCHHMAQPRPLASACWVSAPKAYVCLSARPFGCTGVIVLAANWHLLLIFRWLFTPSTGHQPVEVKLFLWLSPHTHTQRISLTKSGKFYFN